MVSFPNCCHGPCSRHSTLVKPLSIVPALSRLRMPSPSWCPRTPLCGTQYQRHLILGAQGRRCQVGPDSSGSQEGVSLVLGSGSTREGVMERSKQGNISGNSVTFPWCQASGRCASSGAIPATRKWVTIKEERYDQLSSSTRRFWPLLPDTAFLCPTVWLLRSKTKEFYQRQGQAEVP